MKFDVKLEIKDYSPLGCYNV